MYFGDKQTLLMKNKKVKEKKSKYVSAMIGSGELSFFTKLKKGEHYMLADGSFVRAGETLEESKMKLEDDLDDIMYSKPVALIKKIKRRIR